MRRSRIERKTAAMDNTKEAPSLCHAASTSTTSSEHRCGTGGQVSKVLMSQQSENSWVPALQGSESKSILKHCLAI